MTIVQQGSWPGWLGVVTIELADHVAIALFSAVSAYRNETGRHDADSGPLVMPLGGKRTVAECTEMLQAYRIYKRIISGDMSWALSIYTKYNMDKGSNAPPALNGPHNAGYCADIAPVNFWNWMIVNGQRFGWRRTLVAENDLRHFQYFPGTATAALNVTSLDGSTAPNPEEFTIMDADTTRALEQLRPIKMYALADDNGNVGGYAYFGPGGEQWNAPNPDYVALIASLGLSQSQPIATIRENVHNFLTATFLPATNLSADQLQAAQQVTAITKLDLDQVKDLLTSVETTATAAVKAALPQFPTHIEGTIS